MASEAALVQFLQYSPENQAIFEQLTQGMSDSDAMYLIKCTSLKIRRNEVNYYSFTNTTNIHEHCRELITWWANVPFRKYS